jgi:hypothetical protein
MVSEDAPLRSGQLQRNGPGAPGHRAMGRVLVELQAGCAAAQRGRHRGVLSHEDSPASPRARFGRSRSVRRFHQSRQSARHACSGAVGLQPRLRGGAERAAGVDRAHGVGRARQAQRIDVAIPDLHVQHLLHRTTAGHHPRNQLALRCGRVFHQWMAGHGPSAGLLLRGLPAACGSP